MISVCVLTMAEHCLNKVGGGVFNGKKTKNIHRGVQDNVQLQRFPAEYIRSAGS